jgi:hypothetical protein
VPVKNIEASTCVEHFVSGWVARFGVPDSVTSDRGSQFTSALWAGMCKKLGIRHVLTTAFHPQSNGMVERVHRQIKDALRARAAGVEWHSHLPWVLLGLRAAPKEISGVSSAEAVLGEPLRLPGEIPRQPPAQEAEEVVQPPVMSYAAVADSPPAHLRVARFVYVRRGGCAPPLAPLYAGPYEVKERHAKTFVIRVGTRDEVVSVDRLKPHTGPAPVSPASPPTRGRPPSGIQPASS